MMLMMMMTTTRQKEARCGHVKTESKEITRNLTCKPELVAYLVLALYELFAHVDKAAHGRVLSRHMENRVRHWSESLKCEKFHVEDR